MRVSPSQTERNFSVETILPPHKAQTLVTTARTIDQERWEVSALRFPSCILDNCLLSEKQVLPESRILPILLVSRPKRRCSLCAVFNFLLQGTSLMFRRNHALHGAYCL
jgi:hypothetical protein